MRAEINELKTGSGGSVSLDRSPARGLNLAVPAIRQVSTAYPASRSTFRSDNSNVLTRELLAARHDFIVGRSRRPQSAAVQPGRNRFRGGLPHRPGGPPAVDKASASAHDLPGYDWVFQPPGTLLRRAVEDSFASAASGFRRRSSILHRPS
ncbi:hypothetical protein F2981_23265 (plasmid) [Sinorhizobium meliloti]|nr:hypothetical protein [Sinorhizobium meliloti]